VGIKILHGDCKEKLQSLCSNSINTCITSPPYWGLRDYGTATWEGGDGECDHKEEKGFNKQNLAALADKFDPHKNPRNPNAYDTGKDIALPNFKNQCGKCGAIRKDSQLGLEDTPEEYVANMVAVFREVKRVLRDDGTVWLNLGDSYAGPKGNNRGEGAGGGQGRGKLLGFDNIKTKVPNGEWLLHYKLMVGI
jgi:site-specific DNA-methyltransferase (cytosine-N4-specific)